jgi:uncharacterized membrane protein (DUF373 family)
MALLVFTDFICWFPIALFALTSCFGVHLISLEQVIKQFLSFLNISEFQNIVKNIFNYILNVIS